MRVFLYRCRLVLISLIVSALGILPLHTGTAGAKPIQVALTAIPATRGLAVLKIVPIAPDPLDAVVDEQHNRSYVLSRGPLRQGGTSAGPGTLSILDAVTGTVLITATAGAGPQALVLDPTSRQVVAVNSYGDGHGHGIGLTFLDARTAVRRAFLPLPDVPTAVVLIGRHRLAVLSNATNGAKAYQGALRVIDTMRHTVLRASDVGDNPDALALDRRRGRLYVANYGQMNSTGFESVRPPSVSVLDASNLCLLATIPLSPTAHYPGASGLPVGASSIAVDEPTGHVFVTSTGARLSTVAMLDGATDKVLRMDIVQDNARVTVDPITRRVYVLSGPDYNGYGGTTIDVYDPATGARRQVINLPDEDTSDLPQSDPRTGHVYLVLDPPLYSPGPMTATGEVRLLDPGSTAPPTPVCDRPVVLRVASRARRLFVLCTGFRPSYGPTQGPGSVYMLQAAP